MTKCENCEVEFDLSREGFDPSSTEHIELVHRANGAAPLVPICGACMNRYLGPERMILEVPLEGGKLLATNKGLVKIDSTRQISGTFYIYDTEQGLVIVRTEKDSEEYTLLGKFEGTLTGELAHTLEVWNR